MDDEMIRVEGLRKTYGQKTVLDGVDLAVRRGTVLALLGPNGAGKTTLVRVLATLLPPDGGTATVAGHDVVREPERVRRVIGLTSQEAALDDLLTGEENLLMMGRLALLDTATTRRRTRELLDRFDLADAAGRRVKTYSGGMRRRLDLAISLLAEPPVVFLDEPTTGLDPRSRQTTWAVVEELTAAGTTVLLTTQYLEEADRLADRIVLVDQGRVVGRGTADELKRRIAAERVDLVLDDARHVGRASCALDGRVVSVDHERARLGVATDGSADDVRELLNRMAALDIAVRTVAVSRPSLDDVFFALTGTGTTTTITTSDTPDRETADLR